MKDINNPKFWHRIFSEIEQEKSVPIKSQSSVNIGSANRNRKGQPWWQDIIKKRKKPQLSVEQRRAKSFQTTKQNASSKFKARMKEVYASKEFLKATTKANQDPERNKKISEALTGRKIPKHVGKKISESLKKPESKLQKQKAMAGIYGYVYTPMGKFYSVREAHIYHCNQGDLEALRHQQYGGWFRYNSKHHPDDYYKKK
tara:strand:+ start:163 stop:765 length:603 start_codon:yes stop_codon:yes gene_type:complete